MRIILMKIIILISTISLPNYSIWIFTHLKLCLADAIHNLKRVKLFRFDKVEVNSFQILLIGVTFSLYHV